MLEQSTHWLEIAGTALDGLLLLRVIQLRLHRVYAFLTLACGLALFFDVVGLWLGTNSEENFRVFLFSRFLYVFIYPLVAWDVFEQIANQIGKLRRMAMARLISGLLVTAVLGLLIAGSEESGDSSSNGTALGTIAVILWAGGSTASLAFLFSVQRILRAQKVELPNNTFVWMRYFELSLLAEVVNCFSSLVFSLVKSPATVGVVNIVFICYEIAITLWCIVRLRMIQSDVPSAPLQA
ncbi:MAG TPA: hypothetical protein VE641_00915 [Chthoniobacterales bacterium]|nr:hypothetical protein [Chthoniobacterales bacterium]